MDVRVDKWLWAARFFKTRSLAKQAVDAGHVRLEGKRLKPARTLAVDDCLHIQRGEEQFEVVVKELSERRQSAPLAQQSYQETEASITRREALAEQRKLRHERPRRPDKKTRRTLTRLKRHE